MFVCNKNTAKVLSMLFHFYSEIKKRNTKYEIIMKENNEYQIKWSLSKKASYKAIIDFLMKQGIQDLSNFKIIHKSFGSFYSTLRSDYLDNKPRVVNKHLERIEEELKRAENQIKYYRDLKEQLVADKMKILKENEIEPVKTKLFLFSCGHQLRFVKLAKFLVKKGYIKYPKSLKCPCSHRCGAVYIVGCYEADLYEIR